MRQYIEGIKIALQQPRTRWLLLLAVALCVVFGVMFWDQLWRDTTTRYVRADASLYVRVSIPKYYATSQFESGVQDFLGDTGIPIDARDIKREIAFVQYPVGSSSVSQLIIRTDRLSKVEERLRASSSTFERLSGEHVVIGLDKQLILPTQDTQSLAVGTRGKSLVVYLAPHSMPTSDTYLTQLVASTTTDPVVWYGKARRGSVALYPARADQLPKAQSLVGGVHAVVWTQDQFHISRYAEIMDQLARLGKWFYVPELDEVLRSYTFSRIALVAVPKNQDSATGWVVTDYDWQIALTLDGQWTSAMQIALERMIASVVAFEVPQPSTRRLSDGTPVTVVRPNPEYWQFKQGSDVNQRILEVSEKNIRITLQKTDVGIAITNNPDYRWPQMDRENYGQLPAKLLPNSGPWKYLRAFSSLAVDNSGVLLY